jgi:hypothetical protein
VFEGFQTGSEEVFSETQRAEGIKGQGSWNPGPLLVGLRLRYSRAAQAGDPVTLG